MAKYNILPSVTFSALKTEVSHRTGIPIKVVDVVIRSTFDAIKYFLYNGFKVQIPRFGLFFSKYKKAQVYNLMCKSAVYHHAYNRPKFRFYNHFMDQMKRTGIKGDQNEE